MYEIELWNNWDYPSHWQYESTFDTIEECKEYIRSRHRGQGDFRIIQVMWQE